jgi:hypothetical protein
MRRVPSPGLLRRLGAPAVAVLALGLGACGDPTPAPPGEPSAPSSTPLPTHAPTSALAPPSGSTGSDGLTVRYLDHGTVKTVHVEDFWR